MKMARKNDIYFISIVLLRLMVFIVTFTMYENYNNYDHLFFNMIPNAEGNIKIFGKEDEFIIKQDYNSIPEEEHEIWGQLHHKFISPIDQYVSGEYLRGLKALDIEEVVLTRFDYSDIRGQYYVIESMENLYNSFCDNRALFLFEGQ
tara:strand:+ start:34 stop:474 length:441 start_codon:yes stop_codon:yes gene_type:complete